MRQEKNKWYKFDYLFSWEDFTTSVFVNDTIIYKDVLFHEG